LSPGWRDQIADPHDLDNRERLENEHDGGTDLRAKRYTRGQDGGERE
jgi:hypothetical protein